MFYGNYLSNLKDNDYRDMVFDCIKKEDSPRSLNFQMAMLKEAGFNRIEILHKNNTYAWQQTMALRFDFKLFNQFLKDK